MFDNDFLRELWTGLKFQLPYFAAYLIGIVMAFVNWRRYPKACALVFLACVIKFAAALGYALSGAILLPQLNVNLFEIVTVVIAFIDAGSYGLLLVAVFRGREDRDRQRHAWAYEREPELEPEEPPPPMPGSTDIRERG